MRDSIKFFLIHFPAEHCKKLFVFFLKQKNSSSNFYVEQMNINSF